MSHLRTWITMLAAAGLLVSCTDDNTPTTDVGPADAGQPDAGGDGPPPDLAPADLAPADLAPADLAPADLLPPDLLPPDLLPPDLGPPPDAGPACGGGAPLQSFAAKMVICQAPGLGVAQCDAPAICGSWSLCTASEYRARGGESTAAVAEAWIASCIRNGGALTAPTDAICGSCKGGLASMKTTSWECDGSDDTATSAGRVGVASHGTCHRVGANSAAREAFWIARPVDIKLKAVVCCKP